MTYPFFREILRIARLFLGLFGYALGVVMTLRADLGYGPWDVFHQSVALHLGLTFGRAIMLTSLVIVLITLFMKENVGFGALCNMIFIGIFTDKLLSWNLIPLMRSFVSSVAMLFGSLFVMAAATFLYIGAGYGAGPRDSLMVGLTKRTGKPVGLCRSCLEGTFLLIGWLLGGNAGIGTVIHVFGIGAAVQIVFYVMRFDVKTIHQESCHETFMRLKNMLIIW